MRTNCQILCFLCTRTYRIQEYSSHIMLSNGLSYYAKVPVVYSKTKNEFLVDNNIRLWSTFGFEKNVDWLDLTIKPLQSCYK